MKRTKRVLSLCIAFALCIALAATGSAADAPFPDVTADNPYAEAIALLKQLTIVGGDDKGNFNPTNTITRAEFAKIVYVLYNGTPNAPKSASKFPDVAGDAWFNGYVNWAAQKGIVGGRDTGMFDPNAPVTVAEASKMFVVAVTGDNTLVWPTGFETKANELGLYAGATYDGVNSPAARQLIAQFAKNAIGAASVVLGGMTPNKVFFEAGAAERVKEMVLVATWTRNGRIGSDRPANAENSISLKEFGTELVMASFTEYTYAGPNIDALTGKPVRVVFDTDGKTVLYVGPLGNSISGRAGDFTINAETGAYLFKGAEIAIDTVALVENFKLNTFVRSGVIFVSSQPIDGVYFFGGKTDEKVTFVDKDGNGSYDYAYTESVVNSLEVVDEMLGQILLKNSFGSQMSTGWVNGNFYFNYVLGEGVDSVKPGDIVNAAIYIDCTSDTAASAKFPARITILSKAQTVTGSLTEVTAELPLNINVKIDGADYTWTNAANKYAYADGETDAFELSGRPLMTQENVGKTFTFYLDEAGYIVKAVQQ